MIPPPELLTRPGVYCLRCCTPNPVVNHRDGRDAYQCSACGAEEPRALAIDEKTRALWTPRGIKHWTVGALIEREGKFLLMHKATWPYLWDLIAGHLEHGEEPEAAARRELKEETGLQAGTLTRVYEGEIFPEPCRRGANIHEWIVFRGTASGELRPDSHEVKELRWVRPEEMWNVPFVRPAYVIFDTLRIWTGGQFTPLHIPSGS